MNIILISYTLYYPMRRVGQARLHTRALVGRVEHISVTSER